MSNLSTCALDGANIQTISIDKLKPYKRNARTYSAKQIHQIASSIKEFGFVNPVLADKNNRIIAGHGRVSVAKELGMKSLPVLRIEHLTRDQRRAYMLADNKIALNAGWDTDMLAIELQHLSTIDDFEIDVTGFEMAEIDLLIEGIDGGPEEEVETVPEPEKVAITQSGDTWLIYFAKTILQAQARSIQLVTFIVDKAKFYDRYRGHLNERQQKVIARIFKEGLNGFEGGLSAENYLSITATSRATATRDLADLASKAALRKTGTSKGTRYFLNVK